MASVQGVDANLAVPEVTPSALARNAALNLLGQSLPFVVGIAAMPLIVRGLGIDRFGVLGIVWVVFGYFSIFDFGLGRATTKFLAEALAEKRTNEIPGLVWTSLAVQLGFGVIGSALLVAGSLFLSGHILKVPQALVHETEITLWILGASLPVVLATNGLRATLEGCQRFDLTNILKVPATTLTFLIPAAAPYCGFHLPGIVLSLLISRVFFAVAHLAFCFKVLPNLRDDFTFELSAVAPLLFYGGWITLANVISPVLLYLDRFMIASLLSVTLVGYYTAPFEAAIKLSLIPASLATTIFPACSSLGTTRSKQLAMLYSRSIKYLVLLLAPIVLLLIVFAKDIMRLWLGTEFAAKSTLVLQILVVGVFATCLAFVPYVFLQGLGRPDVVAKLLLLELPAYGILAWVTIRSYGIAGAATVWSARVVLELFVLLLLAWKLYRLSPFLSGEASLIRALAAILALFLLVLATALLLHGTFWVQAGISMIWIAGFCFVAWKLALDNLDRQSVLSVLNPVLRIVRYRSAA